MTPTLRWPLVIVVISALFGSGLGVLFGVSEDRIKGYLKAELSLNQKLEAMPPEAREKEGAALKDKAWQYFKRAHLHGGAIAALSFGLVLVLNFTAGARGIKLGSAYALAVGGFFYPLFWLAAGIYAPSLGTSAAKEKFQFLAGGGILHIIGTAMVLILLLRANAFGKGSVNNSEN